MSLGKIIRGTVVLQLQVDTTQSIWVINTARCKALVYLQSNMPLDSNWVRNIDDDDNLCKAQWLPQLSQHHG